MRSILVVAHKTLGGPRLLEEVGRRIEGDGCRVHLLVPMNHPMGAFTEASCQASAEKVLDEGQRRIRDLDAAGKSDITGEVGDPNPVYATEVLKNRGEHFDEIVISTLPRGISRWLLRDVPAKLARIYPGIPILHVVSEAEPATT